MPGDWDERFVAAILNGSGRRRAGRVPGHSGQTPGGRYRESGSEGRPPEHVSVLWPFLPYEVLTPGRRAG